MSDIEDYIREQRMYAQTQQQKFAYSNHKLDDLDTRMQRLLTKNKRERTSSKEYDRNSTNRDNNQRRLSYKTNQITNQITQPQNQPQLQPFIQQQPYQLVRRNSYAIGGHNVYENDNKYQHKHINYTVTKPQFSFQNDNVNDINKNNKQKRSKSSTTTSMLKLFNKKNLLSKKQEPQEAQPQQQLIIDPSHCQSQSKHQQYPRDSSQIQSNDTPLLRQSKNHNSNNSNSSKKYSMTSRNISSVKGHQHQQHSIKTQTQRYNKGNYYNNPINNPYESQIHFPQQRQQHKSSQDQLNKIEQMLIKQIHFKQTKVVQLKRQIEVVNQEKLKLYAQGEMLEVKVYQQQEKQNNNNNNHQNNQNFANPFLVEKKHKLREQLKKQAYQSKQQYNQSKQQLQHVINKRKFNSMELNILKKEYQDLLKYIQKSGGDHHRNRYNHNHHRRYQNDYPQQNNQQKQQQSLNNSTANNLIISEKSEQSYSSNSNDSSKIHYHNLSNQKQQPFQTYKRSRLYKPKLKRRKSTSCSKSNKKSYPKSSCNNRNFFGYETLSKSMSKLKAKKNLLLAESYKPLTKPINRHRNGCSTTGRRIKQKQNRYTQPHQNLNQAELLNSMVKQLDTLKTIVKQSIKKCQPQFQSSTSRGYIEYGNSASSFKGKGNNSSSSKVLKKNPSVTSFNNNINNINNNNSSKALKKPLHSSYRCGSNAQPTFLR